jgi:oxygen-independent coproporphyrinogen-3 oxidase
VFEKWLSKLSEEERLVLLGRAGDEVPAESTFDLRYYDRPYMPTQTMDPLSVKSYFDQCMDSHVWQRPPAIQIVTPYAKSSCPVCEPGTVPDSKKVSAYIERLVKEVRDNRHRAIFEESHVHSVTIEGGWVQCLEPSAIVSLVGEIRSAFAIGNHAEVCAVMGCQPVEYDKWLALIDAGVNSIRLESFTLDRRELLERQIPSTPHRVMDYVEALVKTGHFNIAVQMSHGRPLQTLGSWVREMSMVQQTGVDSVMMRDLNPSMCCLGDRQGQMPSARESFEMFAAIDDVLVSGYARRVNAEHISLTGSYQNRFVSHAQAGHPVVGFGAESMSQWGPYQYLSDDCPEEYLDFPGRKSLGPSYYQRHHGLFIEISSQFRSGFVDLERLGQKAELDLKPLVLPLLKQWCLRGLLKEKGAAMELTQTGRYWWVNLAQLLINVLDEILESNEI